MISPLEPTNVAGTLLSKESFGKPVDDVIL
jgi:hypothetical protein